MLFIIAHPRGAVQLGGRDLGDRENLGAEKRNFALPSGRARAIMEECITQTSFFMPKFEDSGDFQRRHYKKQEPQRRIYRL